MATISSENDALISSLRLELKSWEHHFFTSHSRKPTRDDIKADAQISARYRQHERLRHEQKKLEHVSTPRKARQQPREPRSQTHQNKRKALRERQMNTLDGGTPQKGTNEVLEVVVEEEVEPTPAFIRCALGPTPQRDGHVLGIFDLVFGSGGTPSKRSVDLPLTNPAPSSTIQNTPSKPSAAAASPSLQPPLRSHTPISSSKRRFLDVFTSATTGSTPLKKPRLDGSGNGNNTPSSSLRKFATPSFLRRSFPLAPIDEEDAVAAPAFQTRRPGTFARSLSSIIQGLRRQEDERAEDEWDILNDLEAEERGEVRVVVEESQALAAEMPLGPDREGYSSGEASGSDDEGEGVLDANGRVKRKWKKKGLKRQTKRTVMRPVLHTARKEVDVVAETQGGGEGEVESVGEGGVEAVVAEETGGEEKKKVREKRKVSAQANPNFRRLNIKNKNSKASGKGGGKRFGRR